MNLKVELYIQLDESKVNEIAGAHKGLTGSLLNLLEEVIDAGGWTYSPAVTGLAMKVEEKNSEP